jgi:paraquat-inducible protein B
VARGLRARLGSGNLITGQKLVTLDFVPDQPPMTLGQGGAYPEIPTMASDDLGSLIVSARDLLVSLQATATSLNGLVSSREVAHSVRSLDSALVSLDRITREVSAAGLGPFIAKLRAGADSADAALKQADATLASAGSAFDGRGSSGDLAGMIGELKGAARSVRILADYLETHPESLIRGKGGSGRP